MVIIEPYVAKYRKNRQLIICELPYSGNGVW